MTSTNTQEQYTTVLTQISVQIPTEINTGSSTIQCIETRSREEDRDRVEKGHCTEPSCDPVIEHLQGVQESVVKKPSELKQGKQRKKTGAEMDLEQPLRRGSSSLLLFLVSWRARDGGVVAVVIAVSWMVVDGCG